ncbi:MAG: amidohydrolase family protein [Syntrophales bacterium]
MITDIHAHLFHTSWYPRVFIDAVVKDFVAKQQRAGNRVDEAGIRRQLCKMLTDDTGATTVRIMDKVGIDKKFIMIVDWGIELGEGEKSIWQIHEEILTICDRFKDRLVAFAGVDPRRADAADLLIWAFSRGARGLKLHPTGGWTLADHRTKQLVSLAADRKLPILVHLGKTVDVLNDANAQPEPFIELAKQFPTVPFIAGHCGFDLWEVFVLSNEIPGNVYFDISGWQERIQGDGTNIIVDLDRLHRAFPGRVCFGTDSPFYTFNLIPAEKQWTERVIPPFGNKWAVVDLSVPTLFTHLCAPPEIQHTSKDA